MKNWRDRVLTLRFGRTLDNCDSSVRWVGGKVWESHMDYNSVKGHYFTDDVLSFREIKAVLKCGNWR